MVEKKLDFKSIPHKESLIEKTNNRVLVLGSRISGSFEFGNDFQKYLEEKGLLEPEVEVIREAGMIKTAILGEDTTGSDSKIPDLPKGVILLPEMRQYCSGVGMSLNSYEVGISTFVENLCREYGVPLVEIQQFESPKQITEGIKQLLGSSEEK